MSADPSQQDAQVDTFEIGIFGEASQFRDFKVVVEGRSFFVNGSFLAERSPFFAKLCFGDFLEANLKEAELKDVTIEEFHEFLMVIGAHPTADRTKVTGHNCIRLLQLSDKWDIKLVRELCEKYIEQDFKYECVTLDFCIELLTLCESLSMPTNIIARILSSMARFGSEELFKSNIYEKMTKRMVAALFTAAQKAERLQNHRWWPQIMGHNELCTIIGCEKLGGRCGQCYQILCEFHAKGECYAQLYGQSNTCGLDPSVKFVPEFQLLIDSTFFQ